MMLNLSVKYRHCTTKRLTFPTAVTDPNHAEIPKGYNINVAWQTEKFIQGILISDSCASASDPEQEPSRQ